MKITFGVETVKKITFEVEIDKIHLLIDCKTNQTFSLDKEKQI